MEVVTLVALAVRLACAAVLAVFGLAKLVRPRHVARTVWKPARVPAAVALAAVLAIALGEVAWACVAVLGLVPHAAALMITGVLGAAVTIYGTVAIAQAGDCGCAGQARGRITHRTLWLRNVSLFGGLSGGILVGPSWSTIAAHPQGYLSAASVTPLTILGVLAVARLIQRASSQKRKGGPLASKLPRVEGIAPSVGDQPSRA